MANSHSLSLSHLRASTEYPLLAGTAEGKCLIHVKLTEACARAIDGLLTSEKVNEQWEGKERESERNTPLWRERAVTKCAMMSLHHSHGVYNEVVGQV